MYQLNQISAVGQDLPLVPPAHFRALDVVLPSSAPVDVADYTKSYLNAFYYQDSFGARLDLER